MSEFLSEAKLKKLYKGTVTGPYIGHFRVYISSYNLSTSFPIDLTQSDFDLLYDIRRSLSEQNAETLIDFKEE